MPQVGSIQIPMKQGRAYCPADFLPKGILAANYIRQKAVFGDYKKKKADKGKEDHLQRFRIAGKTVICTRRCSTAILVSVSGEASATPKKETAPATPISKSPIKTFKRHSHQNPSRCFGEANA